MTQYASDAQYRAGGALKHLDYGNGFAMTMSFNSRLQAATFEVSKPGSNVIKKQFQYYNDGQLKYSQDQLDPKFDRSYEHDSLARLSVAKTGAEARGLTETNPDNRPYRESFGYDAFGHLANRETLLWTQNVSSADTYLNNRNLAGQYDAEGNLLSQDNALYSYDAAGRLSQVTTQVTDQTTQWYDGDGQVLRQVKYIWNAQTGAYWANPAIFKILIRSSVLGGQVVSEVGAAGQKSRTYVYAGGARLAWQDIWWNIYTPIEVVRWEHRDPSGGSFRMTGATGQNSYYSEESQPAELDPVGANVELSNPYTEPDPPPEPEGSSLSTYPSFSNPAHPDMTYTVDGIRVTLDDFLLRMGHVAKDPLLLQEVIFASANRVTGYRNTGVRWGRPFEITYDANWHMTGMNEWGFDSSLAEVSYGNFSAIYASSSWALLASLVGAPQNSGAITDAERNSANNLIDKNYDRCRKLLGSNDPEAPGSAGAALALAAAQNGVDDASMIGAIWQHESGINTIDYYGDAGPAQLTGAIRNNSRLAPLVVGNAYGTWHGRLVPGRDYSWNGSVQDNIATLRNLVRFGRTEYGSNYMTAYWYGPGYTGGGTKAFKAAQARQNRTNYANDVMRIYNKYQSFFNCLAGN